MNELGPLEQFVSSLRARLGDDSRLQERLAEVHHHLVEAADEYEAVGLSREEAEREALRAFGEVEVAVVSEAVRLGDSKSFFLIQGARSTRLFKGSLIVGGIVCAVAFFYLAGFATQFLFEKLMYVSLFASAVVGLWSGIRLKRAGTWQIPAASFLMTGALIFSLSTLVLRNGQYNPYWSWQAALAKADDWSNVQTDVQTTVDEGRYWLEFRHTGTVNGLPTTSGQLKYPEPIWPMRQDLKRYWTGDLDQAKREWAEKSEKLVMSDAKIQEVYSADAYYRSWSRMWDDENLFAGRLRKLINGGSVTFAFLGAFGMLSNIFGALVGQIGLWLSRWWGGGRGRTA